MAFFSHFMRNFLNDSVFMNDPFFAPMCSPAPARNSDFFPAPVPTRARPRQPPIAFSPSGDPFAPTSGDRRPGYNYFVTVEGPPKQPRPRVVRELKPVEPRRFTNQRRPPARAIKTGGSSKSLTHEANGSDSGGRKRRDPELMPAMKVSDIRFHNAPARGSANSRHGKGATLAQKTDNKPVEPSASNPEQPEKVFRPAGWDPFMSQQLEQEIVQRNLKIRWDEIAGLKDAKTILQETMVLPTLMPDFFKGLRRPWKGILMVGPPGTGKTMLAKAVATECGSTFFNVSSSILTSKYRGDSEKIVRLLFDMAKFYAPSTIFIDEVDSLCSVRGTDSEHEASRRFKSELLIHMDGLNDENDEEGKYVMVLAATNHPWDIDEGFRRRFEKRVYVPLPDEATRKDLLNLCLKNLKVESNIDVVYLAKKLDGYSGADITNVCRNAAMMSVRREIAGRSTEEIRNIKKEDIDLPVTAKDFKDAIARCKASVSKKDVHKYQEWMNEFESC